MIDDPKKFLHGHPQEKKRGQPKSWNEGIQKAIQKWGLTEDDALGTQQWQLEMGRGNLENFITQLEDQNCTNNGP